MSSKEPRQSDSVMRDKEIRSILISYLQAQGRELRMLILRFLCQRGSRPL